MKPDICIYHANCADGFGAAWAVWKRFGDAVTYIAAQYGDPPPDVAGKNVVIVDFSYKRPVLDAMAADALTILVLDHHKTAAEDLVGLPMASGEYSPDGMYIYKDTVGAPVALFANFDMHRSGARIAWDFFHPGAPAPLAIRFIEDRDLWHFTYLRTRVVHAALMSYEMDFAHWDALISQCERDGGEHLSSQGAAIERKQRKDIEALLGGRRTMRIGGHTVPVANVPGFLASDTGHALNEGALFSATYFDAAAKRVFSLRSRGDFDVSAIAKQYGGGGHKNAAGFQRPLGWEGE